MRIPIHQGFMECNMIFFHAHTVDGSEIPNNHLGCIKPCKQWDIYPLIGSLSYSLQGSSDVQVLQDIFCLPSTHEGSCFLHWWQVSKATTRPTVTEASLRGVDQFIKGWGNRWTKTCARLHIHAAAHTALAQMKCYSKWISPKKQQNLPKNQLIFYMSCIPSRGARRWVFRRNGFGCQHTLEKHIH